MKNILLLVKKWFIERKHKLTQLNLENLKSKMDDLIHLTEIRNNILLNNIKTRGKFLFDTYDIDNEFYIICILLLIKNDKQYKDLIKDLNYIYSHL